MLLIEKAIIDAEPQAVFDALTDFSAYPLWNPWIVSVNGECTPGHTVTAQVMLAGKQKTVRHRIERVEAPELFQWCDLGWFTVLAFGRRTRYLSRLPDGRCDYRVELSISGPLAWLVDGLYRKPLCHGLGRETLALKAWLEKSGESS